MHKIFIAQKSYCACCVLSLATIRSKYYFNFILNRTRSGQELFDHPSYINQLRSKFYCMMVTHLSLNILLYLTSQYVIVMLCSDIRWHRCQTELEHQQSVHDALNLSMLQTFRALLPQAQRHCLGEWMLSTLCEFVLLDIYYYFIASLHYDNARTSQCIWWS